MTKRGEADQVKIPIPESIQNFFSAETPTRPLDQIPGPALRIMEGRFIRIVHDLFVPKYSGKADVERISHIIKMFVRQEQDPHKLYLSSLGQLPIKAAPRGHSQARC